MRMLPGYARYYLHTITVHQRHPKKNVRRQAIENHEEVIREYGCAGDSRTLGRYSDNPRWGLPFDCFPKVVI